jgi:hypothetical protein
MIHSSGNMIIGDWFYKMERLLNELFLLQLKMA